MKLHRAHLAFVLLSHQRKGEALRKPGLAGTWWPLKDQVLLGAQAVEQPLQFVPLQEASVLENVIDRVRIDRRCDLKSLPDLALRGLILRHTPTDSARWDGFLDRVLVHPRRQRQIRKAVNRVSVFAEARTQVVQQLQITPCVTGALLATDGDIQAEPLVDVVTRLAVEGQKLPWVRPVKTGGKIPGDARHWCRPVVSLNVPSVVNGQMSRSGPLVPSGNLSCR